MVHEVVGSRSVEICLRLQPLIQGTCHTLKLRSPSHWVRVGFFGLLHWRGCTTGLYRQVVSFLRPETGTNFVTTCWLNPLCSSIAFAPTGSSHSPLLHALSPPPAVPLPPALPPPLPVRLRGSAPHCMLLSLRGSVPCHLLSDLSLSWFGLLLCCLLCSMLCLLFRLCCHSGFVRRGDEPPASHSVRCEALRTAGPVELAADRASVAGLPPS